MKFRAKMVESLNMRNLAFASSTLSRLTKSCLLRLSPRHFTLMVHDESSSSKQTMFWCVIDALKFFNEYNIEGVTETNEIYLQLAPELLSTSLSTLKSANNNVRGVKIKLTDKMTPCLTVEIELASEYGTTRSCVHDIPVTIIPHGDWSQFGDPPVLQYSATVELKSMKKLRSVVDKCRKLSGGQLFLCVDTTGKLSVVAESSSATVTILFNNTRLIESQIEDYGEGNELRARIDSKRLGLLLASESVTPQQVTVHFFRTDQATTELEVDIRSLVDGAGS